MMNAVVRVCCRSAVCVGGMVNMVCTEQIPNGKAIFVTNGNITINNFAFSGAQVADNNAGRDLVGQGSHSSVAGTVFRHRLCIQAPQA
jgi:hypothetical protein